MGHKQKRQLRRLRAECAGLKREIREAAVREAHMQSRFDRCAREVIKWKPRVEVVGDLRNHGIAYTTFIDYRQLDNPHLREFLVEMAIKELAKVAPSAALRHLAGRGSLRENG